MRENRLRSIWNRGESAVNGWLQIPDPFVAEIMARQGWDSLTLDMQHGLIGFQAAVEMLRAISSTETTPMVRVPAVDPAAIMQMLDAGAYGIICPMVNNRADAETFVRACLYPPRGNRSFGPLRALMYGGADYMEHCEETILRIAMIETAEALDNIEEILGVEGLDAVYIGVNDLGLSIGSPRDLDSQNSMRGNELGVTPQVLDAIATIRQKAEEYGVVPCIHSSTTDLSNRMLKDGFRLVTVASDERLLVSGSQHILGEIERRAGCGEP